MNAVLRQAEIVTALRPHVSWDEYASLPGVSITRLKELRRSPLHFRHLMQHPKETAHLSLGRAAHCAVLEPDRFDRDFAAWNRRTASGNLAPRNGQHWEGFKAEHSAQEIITADQYSEAVEMQSAVRGNADAMQLLGSGDAEVTLQWDLGGRQGKGRLDWLTQYEGCAALVGLKTSRDCRPFQLGRQAANLGYHLQWAYYLDGYKQITGEAARVFEIVVESAPPHATAVYEITGDVLLQGAAEYSELLIRLAECEQQDSWPGPVLGIQQLELPGWVYGEQEISYVDE